MLINEYILIFFDDILVNSFLLVQFLGLCPFFNISKKIETTFYIGTATMFVLIIASLCSWLMYHFIIVPFNIGYLKIFVCVLSIGLTVQFLEIFINKINFMFLRFLGLMLPLIATNCSILTSILLIIDRHYNFFKIIIHACSFSLSFVLITLIFVFIRERLLTSNIPIPFQGSPIMFITSGIMFLSFMGFSDLIKI